MVLLATLTALGSLGLDFLAASLNQIILYAPRVLVAVLILILGTSAAGMLAEMAGGALSRSGVVRVAGINSALRYAILILAAILAAAVLGIDVAILLAVTVIGLGGVALTASLALGLGLRRLSENVPPAATYPRKG